MHDHIAMGGSWYVNLLTGGGHTNWKKKYCVLQETSFSYFVNKDDSKPRKIIDLTKGRGVRKKDDCKIEDWPDDAKFCFGVALPKRTWYFYGFDCEDVK